MESYDLKYMKNKIERLESELFELKCTLINPLPSPHPAYLANKHYMYSTPIFKFVIDEKHLNELHKLPMSEHYYDVYMKRIMKTAFFLANEMISKLHKEQKNIRDIGEEFRMTLSIPTKIRKELRIDIQSNEMVWDETERFKPHV